MNQNAEKIIFCKLNEVSKFIKNYNNVLLVGNHIKPISGAQSISIPDGEEAKNLDVVKILWDMFQRYNIDKNSCVVSMGGGSASDVVGFAAATYMRGIPFLSIPTTLLAMIDASVGAKRAINSGSAKNLIGCIYPAETVFIDTDFLATLPKGELQNGMSEAIKISLISGFELPQNTQDMILQCIQAKQNIVAQDMYDDKGLRCFLNYGHTLGHALEKFSNYKIRHGAAVAVGMDFAANCFADKSIVKAQNELFEKFEILDCVNSVKKNLNKNDVDSIVEAFYFDKKKNSDKISFVVLKKMSNPKIEEIKIDDIKSSLLKYLS